MVGSYYENLPIFKLALDLVVSLDLVVRNFSQYHKYTLGTELRLEAQAMVRKIAKANQKENRVQHVSELCVQIEDFKLLCNIAKEVGAFQSFKQFSQVMEQVMYLARQAEGWRRKSDLLQRPESLKSSPQR